MFPMVADSLAMGCLLAGAKHWFEVQRWYMRLFDPVYSMALLALILVTNRYMGFTVVSVFGASIINASLAILTHRCVYHADGRLGQLLNWKPIAFIGGRSYSLYLWQQLFLNRQSMTWVNAFPQNIVLACAAALLSHYLLEKPLLALRG
jgi:peptidoglycan/LPS O-acetylase OafA/YrhL